LLISGYFDFDALGRPNIKPYVGAGIGLATNQTGAVGYVTPAGAASSLSGGTSNQLAWSGGFGVGVEISKGTTIDVGYRYVNLGKIQLGSQNALGVNPGYAASGKLMTNELFLGMRF
jgi:opacity protein-like surface antigen